MKVLIVDDEPPARALLRKLISNEPDLSVTGEASNRAAAVELIQATRPDVVLLDVQLGDESGFDVLAQSEYQPPAVIFVTAYEQYALAAFDRHAVDYLLKPFEYERLRVAIERARQRLAQAPRGAGSEKLTALLHAMETTPTWTRLGVPEGERTIFLKLSEIERVEAEGNYVQICTKTKSYLLRESLQRVETRLGKQFFRASRSSLVNLEQVKELMPLFHGTAVLVLESGNKVNVSRSHRSAVEKILCGQS